MMLSSVIRNLFSKPATRPFPVAVRTAPDGYRGAVEFEEDVCIYCGACATRCPANAICVDRVAKSLDFDPFKCVQCGACAEACKKGCVQLQIDYQHPVAAHSTVTFHGALKPPEAP
jgi:formate hydrogenlyase subunit 6/NADH:ubiquinone oxidoreductase subunit I